MLSECCTSRLLFKKLDTYDASVWLLGIFAFYLQDTAFMLPPLFSSCSFDSLVEYPQLCLIAHMRMPVPKLALKAVSTCNLGLVHTCGLWISVFKLLCSVPQSHLSWDSHCGTGATERTV